MRKKLLKILQIKIAVIGVLFVFILLMLQTTWVKKFTTKKLIEELSLISQSNVKVKRSEGILPVSFDLYDLSFEQDGKMWLKIERLGLNRSLLFWAIWKKKSLNLTVHKAELFDIPNFNSNDKKSTFKWPSLPYSSLNIQITGEKINIKDDVFNQKIPKDLMADFSLNLSQNGQVFFLKARFRSDELKHLKVKTSIRGHQKQNILHANIEVKDLHHELIPYYLKDTFPAFISKFDLSGSPDAFIAFFEPNKNTDETFRGFFSASLFPSVDDNDILSCLLNKKELQIQSEINFSNDEGLTFSHLDWKGAEMLFNGQISLSRNYEFQQSYLEGEVLCLDFSKHWLKEPFEGEVKGFIHLLGDYQHPKIHGEIAAQSLAYKHFVAYDFLSNFEYEHFEKNYLGKLTLKANLNQTPLDFSTQYEFQNLDYFDLENLSFSYGPNAFSTSYLKKRKEIFQSTLNFNFEKIALFSSFLKYEVHGDLQGKAVFDLDVTQLGNAQKVNSSIKGSFFQMSKFNFSDFFVTINGIFPWDNWKKFQGEIKGDGDIFKYDHFNWENFHAYFKMKENSTLYKLQTEGEVEVFSSGELTFQEKSKLLYLRQLSGHLQNHPYNLIHETEIEFSKNEISFRPLLLKVGYGQLFLKKDSSKDELILDLKKFPIETLSAFIPKFDAKGDLNLEAHLNEISKNAFGKIKADISQLRIEEDLSRKSYYGEASATLDKKFLQGSLNFVENKKTLMNLSFDLPLSLSLYPFKFEFSTDKSSKINLAYNGQINPFMQMALPQNHLLEGYINANLKLKGPIKEPDIDGFCSLDKGYYENLFLGLVLKDIEMQAESKGHTLTLKSFKAKDGLSGSLDAHGKLNMSIRKHLPYELDIHLNNGQIIQFDFLSASFLGDLKLQGNFKRSYLLGDVKITQAEVNIPANLTKKLPILPVTYLYPRESTSCQIKNDHEMPFPIYFDLNLDVLSNTVIKGRGLNSSWAGKLHITGSDYEPKFKGTLKSQVGTFEFAGRLFELRESTLSFNGRLGKDTSLNLLATHEIMSHLISANLKGPLLTPYLTFKSEPAESERDILSLILFGQKVDSLNTFQGISLTFTLASLSGVYEGPGVIDKLRKGVGLDQLSLGSLIESNKDYTTIQLGKYITRGILITLSRPIAADPAPFVITAYFRKGFQFQTYFDQQQISKLLIQWRFSY